MHLDSCPAEGQAAACLWAVLQGGLRHSLPQKTTFAAVPLYVNFPHLVFKNFLFDQMHCVCRRLLLKAVWLRVWWTEVEAVGSTEFPNCLQLAWGLRAEVKRLRKNSGVAERNVAEWVLPFCILSYVQKLLKIFLKSKLSPCPLGSHFQFCLIHVYCICSRTF